ncbi:hypothetical protein ASD11_13580 [Aeromicrobium sp. Root495]|nr:hypothetical protein ASD11_13580 [Aeromicrobium sp. Root495]
MYPDATVDQAPLLRRWSWTFRLNDVDADPVTITLSPMKVLLAVEMEIVGVAAPAEAVFAPPTSAQVRMAIVTMAGRYRRLMERS